LSARIPLFATSTDNFHGQVINKNVISTSLYCSEIDMDAQLIMEMENKKTRLLKPRLQSIRDAGRDNHHDFTFDYSYWSFDAEDPHFATQEQVYSDLGNDVVDCAYEGEPRSKGSRHSITQL